MTTFAYKAVNRQGKVSEGSLEAVDRRAASFSLQAMSPPG
jgi:type II secretory pathway component PulF